MGMGGSGGWLWGRENRRREVGGLRLCRRGDYTQIIFITKDNQSHSYLRPPFLLP